MIKTIIRESLFVRSISVSKFFLMIVSALVVCAAYGENNYAPKPMYVYSWNGKKYKYIKPMVWLVNGHLDYKKIADALNKLPAGNRALFSWNVHKKLFSSEADKITAPDGTKVRGLWCDKGIETTAAKFTEIFTQLKKLGAKPDYLIMDYESGFDIWNLHYIDGLSFLAIEKDPRFKGEGWDKILGFTDLKGISKKRMPDYKIWNARVGCPRRPRVMNAAIFEPVKKIFPDIKMCNYGDYYCKEKIPGWKMYDHSGFSSSNGAHFGTHQSRECYARLRSFNKKEERTPFMRFTMAVNPMRSMLLSSDVPAMPWIAWKTFGQNPPFGDLFDEAVIHIALCNPDAILSWNAHPWLKSQNPADWDSDEQDKNLDELMKQINSLIGFSGRKTLVESYIIPGQGYALSGMNAGGKSVWRFTPEMKEGQKLSDFIKEREPVTLVVKNKRITIPQSKIYQPEKNLAPLGCWITAPLNAEPVITSIKH